MIAAALATACSHPTGAARLAGDWDAYVADGSTARPGFEGWRRMGFAHFAGADSGVAGSIRRRTGEPMLDGRAASSASGDSVLLDRAPRDQSIDGAWHGDTLTGVMLADGKPAGRRIRLVRRATPFVVEQNYALWPGAVSDSQYAVTEDTARLHEDARRRAARELHRAARRQRDRSASSCSARRTRAFCIRPDATGRRAATSSSRSTCAAATSPTATISATTTPTSRDGYDAVEWAATLPGANGRVGLIGHSDEGRLAWYAAVSAPPHLAAIAPSAATGDPWRIVPYEDMVFSPINVAWACLMRARTLQNISDLDIGAALTHLPLSDLPQQLGCGRRAALGSLDRASHARRVLARARRHDEHREGPRAGAADLRLVRRFARADRLHRMR